MPPSRACSLARRARIRTEQSHSDGGAAPPTSRPGAGGAGGLGCTHTAREPPSQIAAAQDVIGRLWPDREMWARRRRRDGAFRSSAPRQQRSARRAAEQSHSATRSPCQASCGPSCCACVYIGACGACKWGEASRMSDETSHSCCAHQRSDRCAGTHLGSRIYNELHSKSGMS